MGFDPTKSGDSDHPMWIPPGSSEQTSCSTEITMMKRLSIVLVLLLLLALPGLALAAPTFTETVIPSDETVNKDLQVFSDNLTVEAGARVNGNVTVLGGNAEIAGIVNGDVTIMGGNLRLDGPVSGDLAVFGGNLTIGANASLEGDCVSLGGNITTEEGATISCAGTADFHLPFLNGTAGSAASGAGDGTHVRVNPSHTAGRIAGLLGRTLLMSGLAWVIATALVSHLQNMKRVAQERMAVSGVVGLLTTAAVASLGAIIAIISALLTLVCIGLLGFPILFIMAGVFALAGAIGWIVMGSILGERLLRNRPMKGDRLVNTTVAGTALLTFGLGVLQLLPIFLVVPILAGVTSFVVFSIGLGAVTLTLFGRQPYPAETIIVDNNKIDDVLTTLPPS